jgi:sec-independent protein translocase protein TatA
MPIGPLELVIVLVIVLLIFGATRIPEVGRSLGTGMREFKDGILGRHEQPESPAELEASSEPESAPEGESDQDRSTEPSSRPS